MAEAIHCPSCSTRYRLRPERLSLAYRRAKCFTCGGIFPVGDLVQKLLAQPDPGDTSGTPMDDLVAIQNTDFVLPSLTLGDLDTGDSDLLERTLVEAPESLPEAKPELPPVVATTLPEFPPEITETTLSGYTSARDAIDKLFGDMPAQPTGLKVQATDATSMDLEATLSALDSTLGGVGPTPPGAAVPGDDPTGGGFSTKDFDIPSSSTIRLSQAELMAAMSAPPARTSLESAEATRAPLPHEELTEVLPPPPAAVAPASGHPASPFVFAPSTNAGAGDAGAELLRLKIGEEIYGGLTMPQLIAWVEEGRILENHLVARQHSENWLEAHKVPGLRPVFERLRREHSSGTPSLESGIGDTTLKKSLFGGLFGKG